MNQGIGFANNPPLHFLQLTVVSDGPSPIIRLRSKWSEKHLGVCVSYIKARTFFAVLR